MIFSDPAFLFIFLPIVFTLYHMGIRYGFGQAVMYVLIASSFIFYTLWEFAAGLLLIGSIGANFIIYRLMARFVSRRKLFLTAGIIFNIALLAYFKYANFFLENIYSAFGESFHTLEILLPPGISFYTFQQITFLCDCYKSRRNDVRLNEYVSFILFFPHLIAGPIVHHNEFFPQIRNVGRTVSDDYIWYGVVIFVIGLFKKVVLADQLAKLVVPVFEAASHGRSISFFDGWVAALGFTFQIYFDFSAYSDMAVGLALLFGIVLPMNFNSPYKAGNITTFWRHWHITLSRFLKESIYIPLGGNAGPAWANFKNLFVTMVIGGLWHGANWTFILWGAIHGIALGIHKIWMSKGLKIPVLIAVPVTLLFVVITWVLFRGDNLNSAIEIYKGMSGLNGAFLPTQIRTHWNSIFFNYGETIIDWKSYLYAFIAFPLIMSGLLFGPNSWEIVGLEKNSCEQAMSGNPVSFGQAYVKRNLYWVFIVSIVFVTSCLFTGQTTEFIYFDF